MTQPLIRVLQIESDELNLRIHTVIQTEVVLDEISDVTSGSPSLGQALIWNGTTWAPDDVAGSGTGGSGIISTGVAAGDMVVFAPGSPVGSPAAYRNVNTLQLLNDRFVIKGVTATNFGSPRFGGSPQVQLTGSPANKTSVEIRSSVPGLMFYDTTGDANEKAWRFVVDDGDLIGELRSDSGKTANRWLELTRSGVAIDDLYLYVGQQEKAIHAIQGASVELYHNNINVAETTTAVAGGLRVNNLSTGAGFERVLTTSDVQTVVGGSPLSAIRGGDGIDVTFGSPKLNIAVDNTVLRITSSINALADVITAGALENQVLTYSGSPLAWRAVTGGGGSGSGDQVFAGDGISIVAGSPLSNKTISVDSSVIRYGSPSGGSPTIGDILYDAGKGFVRLPRGTAGQVLTLGSPLLPSWQNISQGRGSPASHIENVVGGDGITVTLGSPDVTVAVDATVFRTTDTLDDISDVIAGSPTIGAVLYNDGTNWIKLARGNNGQILTMGSPLLPIWRAQQALGNGSPVQDIRGGDGINITFGSPVATIAVDNTVFRTTDTLGNISDVSLGSPTKYNLLYNNGTNWIDTGGTGSPAGKLTWDGLNFTIASQQGVTYGIKGSDLPAFPRATVLIGSSDGDAINNAGVWYRPDVTAGTKKNILFELLDEGVNATTMNRFGMIIDNDGSPAVARIATSTNVGSTSGTDIGITHQGILSNDFSMLFDESAREVLVYDDLRIMTGAVLQIQNSGDTDWATFSHDGTDFNTDFTNTAEWNIGAGLTRVNLNDGVDLRLTENATSDYVEFQVGGSWNIVASGVPTANFSGFTDYIWLRDGANLRQSDAGDTNYIELSHDGSGSYNLAAVAGTTDRFWIRDGMALRISDSGDTDYVELSHDGTDLNLTFTNTDDWNIAKPTGDIRFGSPTLALIPGSPETVGMKVRNLTTGAGLERVLTTSDLNTFGDGGSPVQNIRGGDGIDVTFGSPILSIAVDSTVARLAGSPMPGAGSPLHINDQFALNNTLRVYDSGNTDYADFDHDGTHFNTTFTNTADWNISGLSSEVKITDAELTVEETDGSTSIVRIGGPTVRSSNSADAEIIMFGENSGTKYGAQFNVPSSYMQITGNTDGGATAIGGFRFQIGVDVYGGNVLRVRDTGGTEYIGLDHDGTDGIVSTNAGAISLTSASTEYAKTASAGSPAPGFFVNNTLTGGGLERVLTTSDLKGGSPNVAVNIIGGTGIRVTTGSPQFTISRIGSPGIATNVVGGDGITVTTGSPEVSVAVDATVARMDQGSPVTQTNLGTFRINGSPTTQVADFNHDGANFNLEFDNIQDFVVNVPGGVNTRTERMVVQGPAGGAGGEPLFEIVQTNSNGNSLVMVVSNTVGDLLVVDNEGDVRALGSLGVGTGFVLDNDAVSGYASFNNTGATNGFLFYTTSINDVRGSVTMGVGADAAELISVNVSHADLLIRRDITAGSPATNSEAGDLIRLERDVTNTTSTTGNFISWADDTLGELGYIDKDGVLNVGGSPAILLTTTAGAGGLQVRNTLTGTGLERVLTVSDLGTGSPTDSSNIVGGDGITVTTGSPEFTVAVDNTVARLAGAGSPITINNDSFAINNQLRIYDSTNTDYAVFSHDGTDFNTDFGSPSTTVDWNIEGLTQLRYEVGTVTYSTGATVQWLDSTNTDNTTMKQFIDRFAIDIEAGDRLAINTDVGTQLAGGGYLELRDGGTFRIQDSGDTDFAEFSHDGTDFNTTFTNTAAWNVDVPILDLTGTSTNQLLLPQVADAATPTLAFGDGDTGFYEQSDDVIYMAFNGAAGWTFRSTQITPAAANRLALLNEVPTSTNPVFVHKVNDLTTGIGGDLGSVSLIAGGVEYARTAGAGSPAPGLFVNNTLTGGGLERVLTTSDLSGGSPVTPHALTDHTDVVLAGAADNDMLYRSGGDWIDTAGALIWDGSTFTATGTIRTAGAAGPALLNETPSASNPTIVPDVSDLTTGMGKDSQWLHLIQSSVSVMQFKGVSSEGIIVLNSDGNRTAGTNQIQGQGAIVGSSTFFTTVANHGDAATLNNQGYDTGTFQYVFNAGDHRMQLFPSSGFKITGVGGGDFGVPTTVHPNEGRIFMRAQDSRWHEFRQSTKVQHLDNVQITPFGSPTYGSPGKAEPGDILYYDPTAVGSPTPTTIGRWVNLPRGTTGQVLTMGSPLFPSWANAAGGGGGGSPIQNIRGGDGIDITFGSPVASIAVDSTVLRTTSNLDELADVDTGSPTRGALLYNDGTNWVALAPALGSPSTFDSVDNAYPLLQLGPGSPGVPEWSKHVLAHEDGLVVKSNWTTDPTAGDDSKTVIIYQDVRGRELALVGYDDEDDNFRIQNEIHGGSILLRAQNISGTARNMFTADPDGIVSLWASNATASRRVFTTALTGIQLDGIGSGDPSLGAGQLGPTIGFHSTNGTFRAAKVGFQGSPSAPAAQGSPSTNTDFEITNFTHKGTISLRAEDGAGTEVILLQTALATSGGAFVNNTLTGVGLERVLTISDLGTGSPVTTHTLGDHSDVVLTGAADNDMLYRSGGNWIDTAGGLTWDAAQLIANVTPADLQTAPTLALGDGDTGFYEPADDFISVALGGTRYWTFATTHFTSNASNGPLMMFETASGTNPTLIPSFANTQSGIGAFANDDVSIIANSIEVARAVETATGDVSLIIDPGVTALESAPSLAFGDGNTGLYESSDNVLGISIAGSTRFYFSGDQFRGNNANSAAIFNEVASATNPTLIPNQADANTGIGWESADNLSLITGGVEYARLPGSPTTKGMLVRNTITGSGLERVLTTSDLATGSPSNQSLNDLTDVNAGSPTIGAVLYNDGTNWVKLARGLNTQVLTLGSPLLPVWADTRLPNIVGGTGITITTGSPQFTITNSDPNVDQNLWLNIASDVGGPVAANTTTDTLTFAGGKNVRTNIAGDTVTINMTGSPFTSSGGSGGSPVQNIRGGDGIDVTFGSPVISIAVDETVARMSVGSPVPAATTNLGTFRIAGSPTTTYVDMQLEGQVLSFLRTSEGGQGYIDIGGASSNGIPNATTVRIPTVVVQARDNSTGHPFQIGPETGVNLRMDGDSLSTTNNGSASEFGINTDGGNVVIGAATGSVLQELRLFSSNTGGIRIYGSNSVDWVKYNTYTTTHSGGSPITPSAVALWNSARSVELMVQAQRGNNYHTTKLMAIHDGVTVNWTEWGTVTHPSFFGSPTLGSPLISGELLTYSFDFASSAIRLVATPRSGGEGTITVTVKAVEISE